MYVLCKSYDDRGGVDVSIVGFDSKGEALKALEETIVEYCDLLECKYPSRQKMKRYMKEMKYSAYDELNERDAETVFEVFELQPKENHILYSFGAY